MGRGRAKAKQTKVARDLKYSTTNTDLSRLQQELSNAPKPVEVEPTPEGGDFDDPYADLYSDDDEDDEAGADEASATR